MGSVWLAHDQRLGVRRAIKLLDPAMRKSSTVRRRFDAEARAMARLQHPNIVTVHDVGEDGEHSWIVMELVHGGSLVERVKAHGPLFPRTACEVLTPVLDALATAHAAGIVHRDVKPHNILLTADGVPKITDFGIAQMSTEAHLTRTGAVMGTIPYMAPEQKQDAKTVAAPADVYGVGATLFYLVTGREPYDLYVNEVRAEALKEVVPLVAAVIDRATRYSPTERYPSAAEMRGALLAVASQLPAAAAGIGRWIPQEALVAASDGLPASAQSEWPATSPTVDFPPVATPAPSPTAVPSFQPTTAASEAVEVPRRRSLLPLAFAGLAAGLLVTVASAGVLGAWALRADPPAPPPAPAPHPAPAPAPVPAPEPLPLPDPEPVGIPAPAPVAAEAPRPRPRPAPLAPVPAPAPEPAPAPVVEVAPPASVPTPPPAPTGSMFVNSRPGRAKVLVDGQPVGVTPYRGEHPPGPHTVEIVPEAGAPISRTLTVEVGARAALCWDFLAGAVCPR